METAKRKYLSSYSVSEGATGGQGVHREVESEGFEENHRVVVEEDEPVGQR